MDFVLNEEVDKRHEGAEECACQNLPVPDCSRIWWAQCKTSEGPWYSCDQVGDHEDIVPVVIIGRGHVRPATTGKSSEQPGNCDDFWQGPIRPRRQEIPQPDERKSGSFCPLTPYCRRSSDLVPDVMAINIWKTDRSG